jgi:methionyl-tRNA formyltransferase
MAESEHRLLWLVNTVKGSMALRSVYAQARDAIALVSSYTDPHVSEDHGALIEAYCREQSIDFMSWVNLKGALQEIVDERAITGIVAIGWQYLIPREIWSGLPDKLIVFHDSILPRYRGFAPLATGIMNGEEEFGVSVIYAGEGRDDGDVILQKRVHIGSDVYLREAMERIGGLCCEAAAALLKHMKSGTIRGEKQDPSKATYSIWRGPDDCRIDWKKSAREIYDFIRAVSHPYPGAFSYSCGKKIRIWKSEVVPEEVRFEIRDCGKIWRLEQGRPVLVCGEGLLLLTDMTDEHGNSMLPFTKLRRAFA